MKKEQFIDLAEKYANGTATKKEIEVVESFYTALQEKQKKLPIKLGDNKKDRIYRSISSNIRKKNAFCFIPKKAILIAASFLLIFGIGYTISVSTTNQIITISSAKGERKEVRLADGSKVFLNSNSSISYAENFKEERHLSLKGEAFFKVTKNPKKPFTVSTNAINTRVLGTSFNINTNSSEKAIVSVNTGRVLVVSVKNPKDRFYLTKNHQLTILKNKDCQLTYNNSEDLMAWTQNVIVLNNETIENTAVILENWFDIKIDFMDNSFKSETLSGKFKNEKLDNILSSIALLKNLEIKYLTPKHILIRKKT